MTLSTNIAMVGFANSGKTTLFNKLTNSQQKTGNFAGITVAAKTGKVDLGNKQYDLTDLPGVPALTSAVEYGKDIRITIDYLAQTKIGCLINVIDATQMRRQLYLTSQLLALGLPMVVVISKDDRKEAASLNLEKLSKELKCPVISGNCSKMTILSLIEKTLASGDKSVATLFNTPIGKLVDITSNAELLNLEKQECIDVCNCKTDSGVLQTIKKARYSAIDQLLVDIQFSENQTASLTQQIDKYLLSIKFGIPVFLLMMYLLFMFAINVGSAFIDFFDVMAGTLFVEYPMYWLASAGLPDWLTTIVEGIGMGLQTVMTFIPVVTCLFIGLSLLEASGYLSRAAFVVEALMQKIGLPGKAFVPLIVGFGCTVPAVMGARILDSERERITTIMMSPFMSCGARLPVYALFAAAFFPSSGQNIVFSLYLIGIAAAIFTGFLLRATILQGNAKYTVMELPLYDWPGIIVLARKVTQRVKSFVTGAGKIIVVVVCLLNFFNSFGIDGEFGHQDSETSILTQGAQVITPLLSPMGIQEDNWQAGVGIITGIFAKEALVATFNSLYSTTGGEASSEPSIIDAWNIGIGSIAENLLGIAPEDPLGVKIGDVSDLSIAAQEQEVAISTYIAMQQAFDGRLGAFSYLLFILLYTPCAAAMGAIKNETNTRWALFAALWSFGLAYIVATVVYQLGNLHLTPLYSSVSLAIIAAILCLIYLLLKKQGGKILTIPIQVVS
ncbi:ferrous iron transport protein B [Thalassotalea sp. M1531]|uniref:Ferrous iron transport protein B n=1 Tax=Thalassotalea algicola TaxID=2716224 RepID=A0A7Y0Q920_9GAMM|nr:ferrous iron transport protein B [Thalassotalea algicola]NMP32735.1 ferrous iron transport protein B [Thalassotalea algicola]